MVSLGLGVWLGLGLGLVHYFHEYFVSRKVIYAWEF